MSEEVRHTSEPEFAALVAIDWADKKHVWRLEVIGTGQRERGELVATSAAWANAKVGRSPSDCQPPRTTARSADNTSSASPSDGWFDESFRSLAAFAAPPRTAVYGFPKCLAAVDAETGDGATTTPAASLHPWGHPWHPMGIALPGTWPTWWGGSGTAQGAHIW